MVDSTERGVVDSGRETLVGIADVGWWIGSLCVVLVNVVAAGVSERVHNICVWRRSLSHCMRQGSARTRDVVV